MGKRLNKDLLNILKCDPKSRPEYESLASFVRAFPSASGDIGKSEL